jgi:isoamylase
LQANADLMRFVSRLIAFRKTHKVLAADRFYSEKEIEWLGAEGMTPDWHGHDNQFGCVINEPSDDGYLPSLCFLFNATLELRRFTVPSSAGGEWHIAVDTSQVSPADFPEVDSRPIVRCGELALGARAAIILVRG